MACQKFSAKKHSLVVQACAFLNTYKELRGECQEGLHIFFWYHNSEVDSYRTFILYLYNDKNRHQIVIEVIYLEFTSDFIYPFNDCVIAHYSLIQNKMRLLFFGHYGLNRIRHYLHTVFLFIHKKVGQRNRKCWYTKNVILDLIFLQVRHIR